MEEENIGKEAKDRFSGGKSDDRKGIQDDTEKGLNPYPSNKAFRHAFEI
jgi:hypothetical protein